MKTFLTITALLTGAVLIALGASPSYVTKSASGNNTAGAAVIFPSEPAKQIRIVKMNWNSDNATAALSYTTASHAYSVSATNSSSTDITNRVNSTNGLTSSSVLVLEHSGVGYAATLSSWSSNATLGTYVVLASGRWGTTTSVGDNVYQMGSATADPVGATTNFQTGTLYVGEVGRPVRIQLTPATTTNKINSAIALYE